MLLYSILYYALLPVGKIFFRIEARGRENVPRRGAFVAVANHYSLWDPLFVAYALWPRKAKFLVKKKHYDAHINRFILPALGQLKVGDRGETRGSLVRAIDALRKGDVIGIFPEGTRQRAGIRTPAKRGAGELARLAGVPVVPIYVDGSELIMPPGRKIPRFPKVVVRIGTPISPLGYSRSDELAREAMNAVYAMRTAEVLQRKVS